MRLGQLSRKLSVRTGDILEFLSTINIQIENDSNTRLDDNHVTLIVQHFAPGLSQEAGAIQPEVDIIESASEEDSSVPQESSQSAEPVAELNPAEETPDAVIKAPKIELSGLKILGKIDLPERKKKETAADFDESTQTEKNEKDQKHVNGRHGRLDQERRVRRKNPIALQREQEALQAEKQRQEQALRLKEQRTQNYLKRVKTAPPTKSARLIQEPTEELSKIEEKPTTLFGRFLQWLKR